jgi:hypothetical protein
MWLWMAVWYFPLFQWSHSYTSINGDKHSKNNCHWNYWHHGHNCHSDYRSNRKYHRAIHSYISINGDKYFRNNTHCNYWHHWHHRHNSYSDHWNNGK